ncbi:MAG: ComF family protein [Planctomycetota bacterium]|jgi:ComF family protein
MSGRRLANRIKQFFAQAFSAGICQACGCEIDHTQSFCAHCDRRLTRVDNPCRACALPCPDKKEICPRCLLNPPRWQSMTAPFEYNGLLRDYLIQFKFNEASHVSRSLCNHSIEYFNAQGPRPEVLMPVPLHRERLLDRGYNQALEIARQWSTQLDIPVDHNALQRNRATSSQSGLSAAEREKNILKAFHYQPKQTYRHVAVVDDIVTTGSTVNEITKVLHRGGVEFVEVWALARVVKD